MNRSRNLTAIKQNAIVACQNNEFDKARVLLEEARQSDQIELDTEAYSLLGSIYGQLGNFDDAINSYRKAISINPDMPQLHFGLAHALDRSGRLSEAESSFKTALQLQPGNLQAVLKLGIICYSQSRLSEAEHYFTQALDINPESMEALLGLGRIYHQRRKPELAGNYLNKASEINAGHPGVLHVQACIAQEQGQWDVAEEKFNQALKIHPGYVDAIKDRAHLYMMLNKTREAREGYQRILSLQPDNIVATIGLAKLYDQSGDIQASYDLLNPLMEKGIVNAGLGIAYSHICRHFGRCREAVDYLEKFLEDRKGKSTRLDQIHFSLGKLYDSLGEYDRAFSHYHAGNLEHADTFNPIEHGASIDNLIATCNWSFFNQAPRSLEKSDRPIFIVGMPRSGTTLTEQILSSHPEVYGAGEIIAFPNIIRNLPDILGTGIPYPENLKNISSDQLTSLSTAYLEEIGKLDNNARHVTDKTLVNFLYLGLISLMFPNAKVIHCVRDPRDTCLSIYFQNFDESHSYANRLENLGYYYSEYKRIMAHWKSLLDIPILEVQYEEIVRDQENVSRELIKFAGLEWDEKVLKFYESKRSVATASYDQVRQKIYTKSTHRWKNYENHIAPLVAALGNNI